MEHKSEKSKETTSISSESHSFMGSVWSAAGHLAETVQHVVAETVDKIQHEPITSVSGFVAHKVADTASVVYNKTAHVVENVVSNVENAAEAVVPSAEVAEVTDRFSSFFSSPTDDLVAATKDESSSTFKEELPLNEPPRTDTFDIIRKTMNDTFSGLAGKLGEGLQRAKEALPSAIAIDSDSLLAVQNNIVRKNIEAAREAVAGKKENVKSTSLLPIKLDGEFKLELTMDVVAHLQRIADRTGDAILHETARKAHSACAKGQTDAPGVHLVRITPEQATELVNLAIRTQDHQLADFARYCQSVAATSQIGIEPSPGKILEELAKGKQELDKEGRVHTGPGYGAAFASISRSNSQQNLSSSLPRTLSSSSSQSWIPTQTSTPAVATSATKETSKTNLQLNMEMVAHLQRIADRTGDEVLHDTARKAHSACAKGLSDAPGVHLVTITPDQASELVNLAIHTQDHALANFARYCQSVAATNQIGIEPTPGKIADAVAKGQKELAQQGRVHTGPGYGAAFASISRSTSQQNLLGNTSLSRSTSQQDVAAAKSGLNRSVSLQALPIGKSAPSASAAPAKPNLQLTMDVVAHLQRIADRTGDSILHDTARKAHSACAKNLNEAPGVHLTWVTPDQATELVNLAIRTQDHGLADFARYCQSVAATSQIGIEPSPGKILQEIEKGRQELQQQGRAHTGPGYGAAFASASKVQQRNSQGQVVEPTSAVGQPSQ